MVDEATRGRLEQMRTLREELRKIDEEISQQREQLEKSSNANRVQASELTKTVIAELTISGEVSAAELSLDYFVGGARWAPAYQCRLSRDCRSAEMLLRAMICQRTGEDWTGVALELSTASPMRWSELPELPAIKIGKAQASLPSKRGFRPPPEGAGPLFGDFDRGRQQAIELMPRAQGWDTAPVSLMAPGEPAFGSAALPEGGLGGGGRYEVATQGAVMLADVELLEEPPLPTRIAEAMPSRDEDARRSSTRAAKAMAPPPPPMMAPAPAAARPAPAAPSRRSKKVAKEEAESVLLPSEPALEALVYTQLRLGSPYHPGLRNKLQPLDVRSLYLEVLSRARVEVQGDVMEEVEAARERSLSVLSLPLPAGASDVSQSFFDFAYSSDAPVDVPSDGGFHSISLGSRPLDTAVRYVVVPREDQNVYRVASLKNLTASPFLPGPVEVYVGGEYVLATTLPVVPPRGEFPLGLGVEQAVKCARNAKYRETRSGTKVVATHELWHELSIELANNLEREIACEVRERIPQPGPNAEVVVEEGVVEPAWEPYDQSERDRPIEGGRRWQVVVPAHQRLTLAAAYVIKIYANNEIAGGNRREA
jgi:hypothetical protein